MAHGPQKKRLDFGVNPDSVTLELRLRLGDTLALRMGECVTGRLLNKFAISASLAEVCARLNAILVFLK